MPDHPNRSLNQQLYFLTFLHSVIDSYATLLPHLLPVLLARLAAHTTAKYSLAGALISVYNFFSALNQIFFGWLEDRVRSIHFLTFGVACTAFCLCLLNAAPSIWAVFLLLIAGGHRRCRISSVGDCPSRESVKAEPRVGSFNLSDRGQLGKSCRPPPYHAVFGTLRMEQVGVVHDSRSSPRFSRSQSLGITHPKDTLAGYGPPFIAIQKAECAVGVDKTMFATSSRALSDCRLEDANNDRVGKLPFDFS